MSTTETTTALIQTDEKRITEALIKPGEINNLLGEVRTIIDKFMPDISTAKGRKEVASMAYKISRTKTTIDDIGKNLVADAKAKIKAIDKERKTARDTLDKWRDEIRKPLTEWEENRKRFEESINRIEAAGDNPGNTITDIECTLNRLETVLPESYPEDMQALATEKLNAAIAKVREALAKEEKAEAERQELERLRKEEEIRKAEEEKKRIAEEATERARKEAEEKAQREIAEAKEKVAIAEREKKLAEERERLAEQRAREELERKQAQAAEEQRKRELDEAHRSTVMNEAYADIMALGIECGQAEEIIRAIAGGQVRHVTINF